MSNWNFSGKKRQGGNIAMLFAFVLIVLCTAGGMAIDFYRAYLERSRAQEAADSAIIAGVRRARTVLSQGRGPAAAKSDSEAFARRVFESQFGSADGFTPVIAINGGDISGEGDYNNELPTTLLKVAGRSTLPIVIKSAVRFSATSFLEIHVVVDTSNSLGIGATANDIQLMANTISCAFACHAPDFAAGSQWDSLANARAAGAVLRIDVVRDAIRQFIGDIEASANPNISIALHSISNSHEVLQAATDNFNLLRTSLDGLDIENGRRNGGTAFQNSLTEFGRRLGQSGDGSSLARARKLVVLVTDGVETNVQFKGVAPADITVDEIWEADPDFIAYAPTINDDGASGLFTSQGFNPTICDKIKNDNGAEFATLNIEYRIPTVGTDNDTRFSLIESVLKDQIDDNLANCASAPDLHFRIRDDSQIAGSFDQLLDNLTERFLRITR